VADILHAGGYFAKGAVANDPGLRERAREAGMRFARGLEP
jgi:hypothetical protein